jgi:two-component sensor histidine kinase
MALIHENLYRNENLANIMFSNYVKSLAGNLARTFSEQQGRVSFEYDIDDVYLPLDTGIPCGLIINELLSNSFKYAFEGMDQGKITIKLKRLDEQSFVMEVCDNGVGLPEGLVFESTGSLGMKIVTKLVQQIEGTLDYSYDGGAKFIINFKI